MSQVTYQVLLAKSAVRELQRLPEKTQVKILDVLDALQLDPRPAGSKKLISSQNTWRVPSGDYRVIYQINDVSRIVDVSAIRHRRDAYR
jgi:mRNA interferase RelE/StbE